jgi:hypothetical protein
MDWRDRYDGAAIAAIMYASVDGVDMRIREPSPFNRRWYSHKFHGPGLRYEVGVSIISGKIVWVSGPFPAGIPDLVIFRGGLKLMLDNGEQVVADKGYRGEVACHIERNHITGIIRARHETVNARLKMWNCLQATWRHDLQKHILAFNSIAIVTQMELENGQPLFNVDVAYHNNF